MSAGAPVRSRRERRADATTLRLLALCSWCGPAALVVTCGGWLLAGLLPLPLGPADSTAEVVRYYGDHTVRLAAGHVIASLGVVLVLPLAGVVAMHMLRAEGRVPILAFVQLGAAATTVIFNLVPQLMWAVLAYRPETRSPELTQTVHELAWFLLFTPIMPFIVQNVTIALAILTGPDGPLPRWVAYLNLLVAFAFVPDVLAYFFFSGPFAWNGVFVFWLALVAYAVFLVAMCVATLRANRSLVEAAA